MNQLRRSLNSVIFIVLAASAFAVSAQQALQVEYTVAISDPASRQFHITTDIKNISQPRLDLSLPTWTPGWYTVENYAKNLLRFKVTDEKGNRLPLRMSRKQTWNIDTRGRKQIKVEYDYRATVLGLNQAKITDDYAFFTGIEMFLQPEGHRETPSTVRFEIPENWKLASPLKATADPKVFTAVNYDTLVDAPALMGNFDQTIFEVDGKPHYFTAVPAGRFSKEKTAEYTAMLGRVALEHKAMFGELPYEKFLYIYFFQPAESNASGALEHQNSFVAFAPAGEQTTPQQIINTGAHEYFHAWNVKRFRPAEMVPYDYSRENETPLLWVSEGFTNYYANVMTYRAGIIDEEQFLQRAAGAASGVESNDARNYISLANASVSTWVGYDTPVAFGISYYGGGQNIAALLDLSIRNDTAGEAGLDDVMRALDKEFPSSRRGFTTADLIGIISRVSKKNYSEFFDRHIFGTEVPDYKRIFAYAGYSFEQTTQDAPVFGFNARPRNGGLAINSVEPNSPAEAAGLRQDDVILKFDGTPVFQANLGNAIGKTIKMTVVRDGQEIELPLTVGRRQVQEYALKPVANPTEHQLKVRQSWLRRNPAAKAAASR